MRKKPQYSASYSALLLILIFRILGILTQMDFSFSIMFTFAIFYIVALYGIVTKRRFGSILSMAIAILDILSIAIIGGGINMIGVLILDILLLILAYHEHEKIVKLGK